MVELDQPRLEALLEQQQQQHGNQPRYGAELLQAVSTASELGIPVLLGDVIAPLEAVWRDRPVVDLPRLGRAISLARRPKLPPGVMPRPVSVWRTLAEEPRKGLPLAVSVALTAASIATASCVLPPAASAPTPGWTPALVVSLWTTARVALPLAVLVRFVDVLLLARDEAPSANARSVRQRAPACASVCQRVPACASVCQRVPACASASHSAASGDRRSQRTPCAPSRSDRPCAPAACCGAPSASPLCPTPSSLQTRRCCARPITAGSRGGRAPF